MRLFIDYRIHYRCDHFQQNQRKYDFGSSARQTLPKGSHTLGADQEQFSTGGVNAIEYRNDHGGGGWRDDLCFMNLLNISDGTRGTRGGGHSCTYNAVFN